MKPIGRTYLIECDPGDSITNEGGIFVINDVNRIKDGFWKGRVAEYGTTFTEEEIKDLVPIGSLVVMDTSQKAVMKLVINRKIYYVRNENEIIGVIEDE